MSRLYFIDPIIALYMMRYFGVKLRNFTTRCLLEALNAKDDLGRIYVNSESESIFEPKDMDYGIVKRPLGAGFCQYYSARGFKGWNYVNGGVIKEDVEIILRDGKQFFQALKED